MFIFGQFENKLKGLAHTVLDEFLLGLLQLLELIDEDLTNTTSPQRLEPPREHLLQVRLV